jgi:hypothetical protein
MENNQEKASWTSETLRLHLTALMDRDKEAAREAVRIALEAVKDRQDGISKQSTMNALLVSVVISTLTLIVMFFFHK